MPRPMEVALEKFLARTRMLNFLGHLGKRACRNLASEIAQLTVP